MDDPVLIANNLTARYEGTCYGCGKPIRLESPIQKWDLGSSPYVYTHVACSLDPRQTPVLRLERGTLTTHAYKQPKRSKRPYI